ncbi:pentaheme c-type cytochrome TorC [Denitrobaculum tricleocarpae]|uniref:pentaheme c-type cytochrome TorC n=1 Tax=Denitrobaculum tricleocarpae TaxID=2591009 RepID=UPI001C550A99|nr:pentaheme c-type cytochrome TorC [Denitrobaculum tricleocarpae]
MGFIRRLWDLFWKPSGKIGLGVLLVFGGFGGVIFWGGFNTAMEATNTMGFCISCHEMESTVYQEYKETIHYKNASGVQATCSDCHVPRAWTAKLVRKIEATGELYHHFVGTIDTKEKFEAHRATMAKRVWATMEANDSQECRNCHTFEAMDFHAQRPASAEAMQGAQEKGETCISCHKGIAHKMPDLSSGYLAMFDELRALSQEEGARADKLYTIATKDIFAEASTDGKPTGRLLAATELDVIERKGDLLKVRLDGWQQDGVERVVYALRGQRIFSATLSKAAIESVQRHQTEIDENTELTWHRVSVEAWTPKADLISDVNVLWEYGAEMYNASCSTCHTLSSPDHLLANQWIGNLKAMSRFISLDKEQYRFLQKYLQFHASDTGGKGH